MRTLLFSESPMDPLEITRQRVDAGLAFEKHRWTFPTSLAAEPLPLFDYRSVPGPLREQYWFPAGYDHPEAAMPLADYLVPGAVPQPPLHYTLLYEVPASVSGDRAHRSPEQSLAGRLLASSGMPLYLAFYPLVLYPEEIAPQTTIQVVETVIGQPWQGPTRLGLVPLLDAQMRYRALMALGIKGFANLYIIATSVNPDSLTPRSSPR